MAELAHSYDVEIVGLVSSLGHRYDGRPGGALPDQDGDRPGRSRCAVGTG